MPNIYSGAAIADGAADIEDNRARKAEARSRQTAANIKLEEMQRSKPLRDAEYDMALREAQAKQEALAAESVRNKSYNAFDKYEADKNPRHINKFLENMRADSYGADLYGDYLRVDALTDTPENRLQLEQIGVTDVDGFFANKDEVANLVLATKADGTQEIQDMDQIYAMTDYLDYMDDTAIERWKRRNEMFTQMRYGMSYSEMTEKERVAARWAEAEGISLHDAYRKLNAETSGAGGSTRVERYADELMRENPNLTRIEALDQAIEANARKSEDEREAERLYKEGKYSSFMDALDDVNARRERSTDQKEIDEVNATRDSLYKEFEKEGGFHSVDMTDPAIRRRANRYIARLEKNKPLSAADRASVTDIRELTHFADVVADKMTDEETGLLDNLLNSASKYVSNNTEHVVPTSAYEAYRNTMRHALFGATQSTQETKNFQAAIGNLGQQTGPVLAQFKSQTMGLKQKLESIYQLNDPDVAYYYLGMSQDKLAKVITQLDNRIKMFDRADMTGGTKVGPGPEIKRGMDGREIKAKQPKRSLEELYESRN